MASKVIFLVCSAVLLITTNISLAETKLSSAIENKNLVPVFGGFYDLDAKSFAVQAGTYSKTFPFNENGLALATRWRKNEYIDRAGNIVVPTDGSESIKIAERNERMAYVNYKGEALTSFIYYYLSEFKNGIGVGKARGYVSLIYADGTVVELPHVSELKDFSANGLAIASKNEKFGFINRQGQTIVPIKFDNAQDFTANGLAAVKMGAKWGFVNEQGEIAIPIQFEHADSFAPNGLAAVQTSNGWGYINIKGEVVIADRFSYSRNFLENGLAVAQLAGKYLLINQQGRQVSSLSFTDHKELNNTGYLGVKSSDKWALVNPQGELVTPFEYDDINPFAYANNAMVPVKVGTRWGFVDLQGEWGFKPEFSRVDSFNPEIELAAVWIGGDWFVIDKEKNVVFTQSVSTACFLPKEEERLNGLALKSLKMHSDFLH